MQNLAIPTKAVLNELSGSGMASYLAAIGTGDTLNTWIDEKINEAQGLIETDLGIYIFQEIIKSQPLDPGLTRYQCAGTWNSEKTYPVGSVVVYNGVAYDALQASTNQEPAVGAYWELFPGTGYTKTDNKYPFIKKDWQSIGRLVTYKRPIQSVQRVGVQYGQSGTTLEAVQYPLEWITFEGRIGHVSIEPFEGSATFGAGAMILLPVTGGAMRFPSLPTLVQVDYTAGYLPYTFDRCTDDPYWASPDYEVRPILTGVRLQAAILVLRALERAVEPGGGSIGMWGLSDSQPGAPFQEAIKSYQAQLDQIKYEQTVMAASPLMFST